MIQTVKRLLTVGIGTLVVLGALVIGLMSDASGTETPAALAALVLLLVIGLSLGKLVRTPTDETVEPPPWSEKGAIVTDAPESTPTTTRISGTALTEHIEAAAADARSEGTIEPGIETIREPLRETLVTVLMQGGWDQERVEDALAEGTWTDDPVAAALLDENVTPPEQPLRRRIWIWLFPEKAIRHRTARAVGAIARVSQSAVPSVVGQRAPRPVPITDPTVDELRRAADGTLRRAVNGPIDTAEGDD
jgi:hypothetical protein